MNSDTPHKLFHYEAEPPAGSWDRIASALDEEPVLSFPDRLLTFESTPPAGTWAAIAASLEETEKQAPVIPFTKRFRGPLRYASAAAVLLVLATAVTLLWSKKVESGNLATTPPLPPAAATASPIRTEEQEAGGLSPFDPTPMENSSEEPEATPAPNNTVTYARHHTGRVRTIPAATLASFRPRRVTEVITARRPIPHDGRTERYIVVQDGNTAMRLSRKIFDFFACKDQEPDCRKNMAALQEKMAAASLSPSADFTGVLDLIRNLQENQ